MNQRLVYITPIIVALGLGMILFTAIGNDPTRLETARLNDPVPNFSLQDLDTPKTLHTQDALRGKVRLLNVWATWCPSCKAEHPYLQSLADQGVAIVGLNYKDDRQDALKWLQQLGNPYEFNIYDPKGQLGFDLGVYGAPETYVIDARGLVRYRHVGEVNQRVWDDKFADLMKSLQQEAAALKGLTEGDNNV